MFITVEPVDGSELERFVTALLNVTGVVALVVDEAGEEGIEECARRIHHALSPHAEHHDDDEIGVATGLLALASVVLAEELGVSDPFYE